MSGPFANKSSAEKLGSKASAISPKGPRRPSPPRLDADILTLQRTVGNHSLADLFQGPERSTTDLHGDPASAVDDVLNDEAGEPMDLGIRSFMEEGFGQDFSAVRIHTGEQARASAQALNAAAYTTGHHIVFGSGRYAPSTSLGMHTLAHELTHVVQQRNAQGQSTAALSHPDDIFEIEANSVASRVSGGLSEAAGMRPATSGLAAHGAPPAVQCQTLTDTATQHRALTPHRRHRKPIPDEVKAEMIRQIIAIRNQWQNRLLGLKGSDVQMVVNLVWEYANKGSDAARAGQSSPSDWVDTLIELMSTAVYDRAKFFANYVNLWDDALQNASRGQRAEITKYLSKVDSQYISYQPPDRSKEPSFFGEVVAPVASKALELVSLGILDFELLEDLFIASTDRNMARAEQKLKEAGVLLAKRISGALTFGGAPSAYQRVVDYLDSHPKGDKVDRVLMAIAEGGAGFAEGLENTILPIQEFDTLGREDRTFWQKMEAFFSAILKVITLGEMAKRRGGPREGAPKGEPAAGRPGPAREPSRTETVAPELKEPAKPVTPPEPEVTNARAKPETPAAKVNEPSAAPAPSEKVAPPSSPSSTRPRLKPGHGPSSSAIASERPATAPVEPSPAVRPEAPAGTPGPERPQPTPATPAAAESSPQTSAAGPAQAPTPATASAVEPPAPAPRTATAPPEEIVKATAAIGLEEQLQSVENEINTIRNHRNAPFLQAQLEYIRSWVKRGRTYEAEQLLKNLSERVETAKLSSEAGALETVYEPTQEQQGSPAETASPEQLRERERLPGVPKSQGQLWARARKGEILNLANFENPPGERLRIDPDFRPFGNNGPGHRRPQTSPERLRSLREQFGEDGPTNRQLAERGNSPYLANGDRVDLHHRDQDPFAPLDEHSKSFHESVEEDPDFHPEAGDPGYESWRGYKAFFEGKIRTLGDIYDILRKRYWKSRFE
jgi:hypothetical protein